MPAACFTDDKFLTAIGNDIDYEEVFGLPLRALPRPEDTLVTISSAGQSSNIVSAIKVAMGKGCSIVTSTGMNSGNKCRSMGDLNFYVPAKSYGYFESEHALLLHLWLDQF